MAKKLYRKKRFRKYLRGALDEGIALTTLGANVVKGQVSGGVLLEKAWLSSIKALWTLDNLTPATGQGPIMVGVAHSDYSDAEIEAWIENLVGSWTQGDMVNQEVAKRKIRQIGVFYMGGASDAANQMALNEGRQIRTKCGWELRTGQGVKMWAYNMGSSALATTAPNLRVQGHANLWPA